MSTKTPAIPPAVSKQLVGSNNNSANTTSRRVPQEAAEAISEALRLFVQEAHRRASIEAECDDEGEFRAMNETDQPTLPNEEDDNRNSTHIRAHHVTRIAGDLLMDFS